MNKTDYIKDLEEQIINEGVFSGALSALGHAIGHGTGIAIAATRNAAISSGRHLFGQDKSDPNYDPTNDVLSQHFNSSTYDPKKNVRSKLSNILRKSIVNTNDPNYRPSANQTMMQQLNQQNSAQ